MTTQSIHPDTNDTESFVAFNIPKRIPLAILFAFIIQIIVGVWAVSSFYFGQKELQAQFRDNVTTLTGQIGGLEGQMRELKSSIYTRNEASIQFEIVRQDNARQDQEIRELRDRLHRSTHG